MDLRKNRLARMNTCHAKAMYYGGGRIMLLLLATIMPKENEADIAVLVSKTERARASPRRGDRGRFDSTRCS